MQILKAFLTIAVVPFSHNRSACSHIFISPPSMSSSSFVQYGSQLLSIICSFNAVQKFQKYSSGTKMKVLNFGLAKIKLNDTIKFVTVIEKGA